MASFQFFLQAHSIKSHSELRVNHILQRELASGDILIAYMARSKKIIALYLRNFVFGVEDSLVSTVGLLAGVAVAEVPRATIFLTGMVLIFVEAFSMAIGSLVSEKTAEEYLNKNHIAGKHSNLVGILMFFSYFIAGFVPLTPYAFWERDVAMPISIVASLLALFLLGYLNATKFGNNSLNKGARMLFLGGVAIAAGVIIGYLLK